MSRKSVKKASMRSTDTAQSYRRIYNHIFERKETRFLRKIQSKKRESRHEHFLRNTVSAVRKERVGDKRLEKIRETLTQFGLTRSKMQKLFHEAFLQATSQHIFKLDKDVDFDAVRQRQGWTNNKQQILCLTPRRFGKTTAVSMFVAAYAWVVGGSVQSVFSTGRRASYKLLQQVREMLMKLPGAAERVGNIRNQEDLYIQGDNEHDVRKISSYPGVAKTLRGTGGDVIYLEEAAFLPLDVFYEVIVPLLELDTTALIGISTPMDDMNFYSEMFELKDANGEMFFNTIKIGLVCSKCQKLQDPTSCTHMSTWVPPWKSVSKLDMVKALYGSQKDLLARESMGQITQGLASVFKMKWINNFMKSQSVLRENPNVIFTSCDPSGSGSSEMSIISLAMIRGQVTVLAIDLAHQSGHDYIKKLLLSHIDALRSHEQLRNAWIVFIPEANLGNEASHMKAMLCSYEKIWTYQDNGKDGIITSNSRKELFAAEGVKHLSCQSITMWDKLLLPNPFDNRNYTVKKEFLLKKLTSQLAAFSKIIKKRGHSKPLIIFSGKGPNADENDDFVLALLIGLYFGALWVMRKSTFPYEQLD
tara:strand:- start:582 stop:2345 length:1764 start_codon:yes stop_codon:yes gene_type:complete